MESGGCTSFIFKCFKSTKSKTFKVTIGFDVPGFGNLKEWKICICHNIFDEFILPD